MDQAKADFEVRGLELHSRYAWDYPWVVKALDFIEKHGMNTLVLHRNDFVDLIVYPGAYFGYKEQEGDSSIFDIYSQIFRKLYQYTPTRRSCPYQRRSFLKRVLEEAGRRGIPVSYTHLTQVIKSWPGLDKLPTQAVVIVLSLILCPAVFIALMAWLHHPIDWYTVFACIIAAFIVALVALDGWERVAEIWKRTKPPKTTE